MTAGYYRNLETHNLVYFSDKPSRGKWILEESHELATIGYVVDSFVRGDTPNADEIFREVSEPRNFHPVVSKEAANHLIMRKNYLLKVGEEAAQQLQGRIAELIVKNEDLEAKIEKLERLIRNE